MNNRPEDALQIGAVKLLRLSGYWPVHVPNEGKRSPLGHMRQVAMGLEPGFPDLLVFTPRAGRLAVDGGALVCAIEMKRPPKRGKRGWGKKLTPNVAQLAMHAELGVRGVPVIVAHSLEDVIAGMEALGHRLGARVSA